MTISYYYKQLQTLAKQRRTSVLWVVLAIVVIFDLFVFQKSVRLVLAVRANQAPEPLSQAARVNFPAFNETLKQIEDNKRYFPAAVVDNNPFGTAPDQAAR